MKESKVKTAVSRHPENPRYFIYEGKPTLFITTTEHYGAVTNTAFNYDEYLDMLQSYGFNLSRIVIMLREWESEFKGFLGYQNTLCPKPDKYAAPWKRSGVPGSNDGGCKFDLNVWNGEFFGRLKDFCNKADERGIIVEITFFSQYYNDKEDGPWSLSILNPANNINEIGAEGFNRFCSCENEKLAERQEALVRRIVGELKGFDNIYYEICNEPPYPEKGDPEEMPENHPHVLGEKVISEWHNHLASVIIDAEADFDLKHMIAVCDPHKSIDFNSFSILNYHYMHMADAGLKTHLMYNKPMVFDETLTGIVSWNRELDFDGRRKEAWEFIIRGGAGYDYLDFTIGTDDPRGEGNVEFPGGYTYDGTMLKKYLKHLKDFIYSFDFIRMIPDASFIKHISDTARAFALVEKGKAYAVYINGSSLKHIKLELPEGIYRAEWFNPVTGGIDKAQSNIMGGNFVVLELPLYNADIALKIVLE